MASTPQTQPLSSLQANIEGDIELKAESEEKKLTTVSEIVAVNFGKLQLISIALIFPFII